MRVDDEGDTGTADLDGKDSFLHVVLVCRHANFCFNHGRKKTFLNCDLSKDLRADLHGTIFVACERLTTGLRHDLRLSQRFKTCFKMLRHFF